MDFRKIEGCPAVNSATTTFVKFYSQLPNSGFAWLLEDVWASVKLYEGCISECLLHAASWKEAFSEPAAIGRKPTCSFSGPWGVQTELIHL